MQHTHILPFFTRRDEQGREQAVCGVYVTAADMAPAERVPTCWGCAMWLHDVDRPSRHSDEPAKVVAMITDDAPWGVAL